ncbi:SMP-30/Gluconolaconase/LRE-like region family protein [Burkholderia pseudomallei MSHR5596]|nr:SMP-30/Gluconolaconase/LRE-like region family protein [Burkholderia pseudomallei MSHR5596]
MVETRRIHVVLLAAAITAIAAIAPAGHAQNATDWLANTYGTLAAHVGNTARSMWVVPEGVIYTASMWDEYEGGVAIYQNGKSVGSIGSHAEFQGGAITGNAASVFVALQYDKSHGSGAVGRYNRVTRARELSIQVSASTDQPRVDVVTGLATVGSLLYASDFYGNRVRLFTTDGVWQRDIGVASPGALAVDRAGNVWVARKRAGEIVEFSAAGALLNTLRMPGGSQPSALYFDAPSGQLMVGDEGPDMNIKRYAVTGAPALVGTFGIQGGYLDTTTGIKGQVGARRFTRVAGIGKDAAGNLYVLNNPWGGSWDLGRNGATDIHAYDSAGNLQWTLQSLNFEGIAAADPATDGALFYGGTHIYAGSAGGTFVANTVDPFSYPSDPRIDMNDTQRDEHFGQLVAVGANRILVASGQNPPIFYFFHFNKANGYVAIPDASLPGAAFNTAQRVTSGFCIDSEGGVWAGLEKTGAIYHYSLAGFDASGKPTWGAGVPTRIPASIQPLTRIVYLAESDTMILAQGIVGSADWTSIGTRIEVYHGWRAGNTAAPDPVITLANAGAKSIDAAGNHLFVGYWFGGGGPARPNVDAFNLATGKLDATLVNTSRATRGREQRRRFDVRRAGLSAIDGRVRGDEEQRQGQQHHRVSLEAVIVRVAGRSGVRTGAAFLRAGGGPGRRAHVAEQRVDRRIGSRTDRRANGYWRVGLRPVPGGAESRAARACRMLVAVGLRGGQTVVCRVKPSLSASAFAFAAGCRRRAFARPTTGCGCRHRACRAGSRSRTTRLMRRHSASSTARWRGSISTGRRLPTVFARH